MPKSFFQYNGTDCRDWNCYKTHPINFASPSPDYETIEVPGRNGDIILDNGRYSNVEIVIECYIIDDFITCYNSMRAFLMADREYHKLVDDLYPDEYRMACVRSVEAKVMTPVGGMVEITMTCQPQRFLNAGDIPITFSDSNKSQQTVYKYSNFTTYTKENIIASIEEDIGYSLADSFFYVLDMSGVSMTNGDTIRVEGGFEDFFVAVCMDDPLVSSSNANKYYLNESFLVEEDSFFHWIFPVAANIKVYVNGALAYENPNTEHAALYNQTLFASRPLVKVTLPSGSLKKDFLISINQNGVFMERPSAYTYSHAQTLTIDCESMEVYSLPEDNLRGYLINWNPYIKFVEAPELVPGGNEIAYDNTVTDVTIIPRWWSL